MRPGSKLYGRTALYRLYDAAGQLLYVGIAHDPEDRWKMHQHEKTWWHEVTRKEVVWYDTRAQARTVERQASLTERPRYDRFHAPNRLSSEEYRARDQAYTEQVLRKLQEDIGSGAFPEGTVLPAELPLAKRYGLARSTMYGGLLRAEKLGLVTFAWPHWLVLDPSSDAARMAKAHGPLYGLAFNLYGLHSPFRKADLIARTRMSPSAVTRELGELRKSELVELSRAGKTAALWTLLPKQHGPRPGWRPARDIPFHDDI